MGGEYVVRGLECVVGADVAHLRHGRILGHLPRAPTPAMKGTPMRQQILGATAAILGASVLSIGLPSAPTHGAAWKPSTQIPFPAGQVTDVEVVSTGPGDAVAAAIISGAVHAYTAVNGVWTGHDQVRSDVDATGLVLAANGNGDAVVGWQENVSGETRLRVSRQLTATSWTGCSCSPLPARTSPAAPTWGSPATAWSSPPRASRRTAPRTSCTSPSGPRASCPGLLRSSPRRTRGARRST